MLTGSNLDAAGANLIFARLSAGQRRALERDLHSPDVDRRISLRLSAQPHDDRASAIAPAANRREPP
jgi:hypothetical protein